jgi:hypothetical protein
MSQPTNTAHVLAAATSAPELAEHLPKYTLVMVEGRPGSLAEPRATHRSYWSTTARSVE